MSFEQGMPPYVTNYVVTKPQKSVGIAILLTLVFGPIGLFYATVTGGLVMLFGPFILLVLMIMGFVADNPLLWGSTAMLLLFFVLFWWLVCMVWAAIGVSNYNRRIVREAQEEHMLYRNIFGEGREQDRVLVQAKNLNLEINSGIPHERRPVKTETRPPLEEWLKSNPGKSINDYFTRFPN